MSEESEEQLLTSDDNHFVFIRPKAIIGSSGSTWANETVRLRQRHPDIFEVGEKSKAYSIQFRKLCSIIQCACFLYVDMTEIKDLSKATGKESCIYTKYEKDRLTHLRKELTNAVSIQGEILITAENKLYESRMAKAIDNTFAKMDSCFSNDKGGSIQETIDEVKLSCVKLLQIIEELELPKAKPRCCDLSHSGPGVGVSNLEVRFRDVEICRMFGSDYRIRLHRSRGDSGQGESAISDAVVDGATINWEKIKQFDGLTTEEVKN